MAIHNIFMGHAQVQTKPVIVQNQSGELTKASVIVGTIRGKRDAGNGLENVRFDCPIIRSGNPRNISEIQTWNQYDMIDVKGTITSREVVKRTKCPHCEAINEFKGITTYINPIFCEKRESGITKEAGVALLRKRCEISNSVTVAGMLVRDPEHYVSEKGVEVCQFQIAVLRKFRILEDAPDRKVDFVWIKTFGKIAKDCFRALRKGSTIFVDGFLQVRPFEKEFVCPECEKEYKTEDSAVEIVPYSVEYLRDFNEQADIDLAIEQENKAKADELLKSLSAE